VSAGGDWLDTAARNGRELGVAGAVIFGVELNAR